MLRSASLFKDRQTLHALLVAGGYTLLLALYFSPVIFTDHLLAPSVDGRLQSLPNFYARRVWWDTSIWGGMPAFADLQTLRWYPPALLASLLPHGWNALMLSAYVLAASFTYGYVYTLTRSRLAATVSGIIYALCGFMIAHSVHVTLIHPAAWLPLFIWSLEMLRRGTGGGSGGRGGRLPFVAGALGIACAALAGHTQVFAYTLGLGAAFALYRGWQEAAGRLLYFGLTALLVALGLGLVSLQLLPTLELTGLSVRASFTFAQFNSYHLPPAQLSTFFFPLLYGGAPGTFYGLSYFGAAGSESGGWNASEVTGYIGLLPLMLAAVGVGAYHGRAPVRFWCGVALVGLLLALGDATPLASLTYRLPVINLFRAPGRHLLELSFAVSVLAGFGIHAVERRTATKRLLRRAVAATSAAMLLCLAGVLLFSARLSEEARAAAAVGRHVRFAPWANPAVGVPLLVLLLTGAALLCWSRRPASAGRIALLFIALLVDLASLGWFSQWRYDSPQQTITTAPAFAARYQSALGFSHQRLLPVRGSLGSLDELPPNLSRLWELPSTSGYGPFMLRRVNSLLSMATHGESDGTWLNPDNRSLDVLATRYVVLPRDAAGQSPGNSQSGDTRWTADDLPLSLGETCGAAAVDYQLALPQFVRATHLGIVSVLACAADAPDQAEVLRVTLKDAAGRTSELKLLAGRHTSEWAYDCADVRPRIKHRRAPIFKTYPTDRPPAPCVGHDYVAELPLGDASEISRIEMRRVGTMTGSVVLKKISLIDRASGRSYPVDTAALALGDAARWRHVEDVGQARIYENLRARPRAWLVPEVLKVSAEESLAALRTSRLPGGRIFDPAQIALVEEPLDFNSPDAVDPSASALIVKLADESVEVETDSKAASFLVLSDVYYPGWSATIDGQPTHLYQADYALRGVSLPAGRHLARFEFRPRSFFRGLWLSGLSLLLLLAFVAPFNPIWKKIERARSTGIAGIDDAEPERSKPTAETRVDHLSPG